MISITRSLPAGEELREAASSNISDVERVSCLVSSSGLRPGHLNPMLVVVTNDPLFADR
jgi:hypothetical protein